MSKPMGPIPAGFAADDDFMLLIGGRRADDLVEEAGDTPLFVYDLGLVRGRIGRFRSAFPGVHLHYAVKANPFPPLLERIGRDVDGLDVASGGELELAIAAGADPARISFAGPGEARSRTRCRDRPWDHRQLRVGGRGRAGALACGGGRKAA